MDGYGSLASADLREQVFCVASDLRNQLDRLLVNLADREAIEAVVRAGASVTEAVSRCEAEPVRSCGRVLARMTRVVGDGLRTGSVREPRPLCEGLFDSIGTLEQLLDAALDEAAPGQLARAYEALPASWRSYGDLDDVAFEARVAEIARSGAAARRAEAPKGDDGELGRQIEFLEAFAGESEDRFESCEDLLLRLERQPDDQRLLKELTEEFQTLREAAEAVGLDAAAGQLRQGAELMEAVYADVVTVEGEAFVDFLLRLMDSIRSLIGRASGRGGPGRPVLQDVAAEIAALCASCGDSRAGSAEGGGEEDVFSPGGIAELVTLERVFRRLRRPVREAAREEDKLVDLDLTGEDVLVAIDVAERIYDPLLHMVRDAIARAIEAPPERESRGLPAVGVIAVRAERDGGHLLISIEDDGAAAEDEASVDDDFAEEGGAEGEEPLAAPSKPEAYHWIDASEPSSREELERLVYRPGFLNVLQVLAAGEAR